MAADRNDIEALARKVHAATNVPMFSPRTFADLFRVLAQEIGEHGYHFQNTAENVTDKLVAAGRNANRRQVLFVVKGLALKGHVFSTTDTPERLAEAFREQVLYLIGSSGLELDERETAMLPNWIIGRTPTVAKPVPTATPPKPAPTATSPKPASPVEDAAKKGAPVRRRVTRPAAKEEAEAPVARAEPRRPNRSRSPSRPPRSGRRLRSRAPRRSPRPAAGVGIPTPAIAGRRPQGQRRLALRRDHQGQLQRQAGRRHRGQAAICRPACRRGVAAGRGRIPAGDRVPPLGRRRPAGRRMADRAQPGPPPHGPAAPKPAPAEGENDALESSILAAIAQAVDVLVDDDAGAAKARDTGQENEVEAVAVEASAPPTSQPEPPPDPEPSPGGDSEDIGDEIQRIIASYSRARTQSE